MKVCVRMSIHVCVCELEMLYDDNVKFACKHCLGLLLILMAERKV